MPDLFSRRALIAGLTAAVPVLTYPLWRPRAPREIAAIYPAVATKDGAGVRLLRALGHQALRQLDPFLLLDQFRSDQPGDYIKGFPKHPHRGFETVTVMLQGAMEHQDSMGNRGRLGPGSLQWMTAGKGIIHSEMPKQEQGLMWGYQLWINLPAKLKMMRPRYQDNAPSAIPAVDLADASVRVLAGRVGQTRGPVDGIVTEPIVLDARLQPGARLYHELPEPHTAMVFCVDGSVQIGARTLAAGDLAVLTAGSSVLAQSPAKESRLLLFAAAPIGEPIARRGPFVMNTEAELDQAFEDYRTGALL